MQRGGIRIAWTDEEDAAIEEFYPDGGTAACLPYCPSRSAMAIAQRAFRLGIKTSMNPAVKGESAELWPRTRTEKACDLALKNFRACSPAANLVPSLGVAA